MILQPLIWSVSLVCVLVLFRASVCAFRVSELLVVRLSFVVKLFFVCVRDSEVFVPSFECEFLFRICRRIFDSGFEFKSLEFSCRILNSPFSFRCSIRLLEFRCSIRFLESDFEFVVEFDFSNFVSNFKFEFVVEIFVSLLYLISRISLWVCCQIRLLEFHCSSRFLEFRVFDSSALNFEFVLIYSTSRIVVESFVDLFDFSNFDLRFRFESFVDLVKFSKSHSSFEFLIELFNFRRNLIIINALMHWRHSLFSHERFRFALVATRALRAHFVRKILVKRQFTSSLYFGIIEL